MEAIKMDINMERELEQSGAIMVATANSFAVKTNADFEKGNDILKEIKNRIKQVKGYWKEPKAAAQIAHKTLVAREAQMLEPLEEAESIIKKAMLAYTTEIERKRREAEEAARRAREEEVKRLEAIAAQAKAQGDNDAADVLLDMAEDVPIGEITAEAAPTAKGASVRTTWKARITAPQLVPAYHDGWELRPIDMPSLNALARESKGTAIIPGVQFYQDATLTVRA